ncbi:MAG: DUF2254 domain-containing protein [Paracoccaceae bacterium]|nr:DUF2254 domain-containing protein [Paracoccaceae bacterium]
MISKYAWYLREVLKKVWVRVAGFALLAIFSIAMARLLSPFLDGNETLKAGADAVEQLLEVLTSSMLAVTTFSLSIAVSAFAAAASTATPRAAILLQEDRTTQNVLATFLGAFLFGLVGLVALNADLYNEPGRVVLFIFTVAVIGLVVLALIRWIDHLMSFGRMGDTLDRVEAAATDAWSLRLSDPYLGGRKMDQPATEPLVPIHAHRSGYVQHIDMEALQDCAAALNAVVYLNGLPGRFVAVGEPVLWIGRQQLDDDHRDRLCDSIAMGTRRTFEEDPRFGLIVLSEIASRALSPAVNDPGTAIDVLGRLVRILSLWKDRAEPEVRFDRVFVPPVTVQEAMEDAFRPLARDGAALVEVQIRLQKTLAALRAIAPEIFDAPASAMAREALSRAEAAALHPSDLEAIRAAAGWKDRDAKGMASVVASRAETAEQQI